MNSAVLIVGVVVVTIVAGLPIVVRGSRGDGGGDGGADGGAEGGGGTTGSAAH